MLFAYLRGIWVNQRGVDKLEARMDVTFNTMDAKFNAVDARFILLKLELIASMRILPFFSTRLDNLDS
jgi:hypothetical protein